MKSEAICNRCKRLFEIQLKTVRCKEDGEKIAGQPINVTAFKCPYCGMMYITAVMTDTMIKAIRFPIRKKEREKIILKERLLREKYIDMYRKAQNGGVHNETDDQRPPEILS